MNDRFLKEYLAHLPKETLSEMKRRSGPDFELELLYRLVLYTGIDLKGVGEIGTWRGLSALWLGFAATERLRGFVTLDIDPAATKAAKDHFNASKFLTGRARCGDSIKLLPEEAGEHNFWFVDGLHSYTQVMEETRLIMLPPHDDIVIIYDDAFDLHYEDGQKDGGVPRAMSELKAQPVPGTRRMGYIYKGRKPW